MGAFTTDFPFVNIAHKKAVLGCHTLHVAVAYLWLLINLTKILAEEEGIALVVSH